MNSIQLQKAFPEVYKDFFGKNDLVVSGCFSMSWGARGVGNASLRHVLKSNLPIRCYVGLSPQDERQITFGNAILYNHSLGNFETLSLQDVIKNVDDSGDIIKRFLEANNLHSKGYKITVLAEIGKWHSMWFTGTFSALLSFAFSTLTKYSFLSFNELDANFRKEVADFALAIEIALRDWKTQWQTIYHTLSWTHIPSLFISSSDELKITENQIPELHSQLLSFLEINKNSHGFDFPFDFAILFSWIPSEVFKLEHAKETDIQHFNDLADFFRERIIPKIHIKKSSEDTSLKEAEAPFELYSKMMSLMNVRTIHFFDEIISMWYRETIVNDFMLHLNSLRHLLSINERQSEFADLFIQLFKINRNNLSEEIAIFPMYSWKLGGSYGVVMKPWMSKETFLKTIETIKASYPHVWLDYYSSEDGHESSDSKIEQFLSKELYSKFLPKWQVRFVGTNGNTYVTDYQSVLEREKNSMVFDTISRKIIVLWQKITSEDLPSQTTVIDVMNILLDDIGQDFEKSKFPASSYMKNKNELVGKILWPIIRLANKRMWKPLPIVCSWWLGDFTIRLDATDLPIGIIREIN